MRLTRIALTRPVFIIMVISAMVLLGIVGYSRLNQELLPKITTTTITVVTTYQGATADDVEQLITKPIEDAVTTLGNIDNIQSTSSEGLSQVVIVFTDQADSATISSDVAQQVNSIRNQLPSDADPPVILKLDPNATPILALALTGSQDLEELYDLAKNTINPRLQMQNGVGQITLLGGEEREIQVQFDPLKLRAYGLSIDQVSQAIAQQNQGVPSGSIDRGSQQLTLRMYGLYPDAASLRDLPVATVSNGVVRLRNVADVVDTHVRVVERTYLNGKEAVGFSVVPQSGANQIATVNAVRAEIDRLNATLPGGARITVVSDTSTITRESLDGVQRSLVEAVILTGLVLLVFLHLLRGTVIVLFAIPTSLITTFLMMYVLGFSLNIMSSMALVLVIGVLVDDSIVVIENVVRHLELGETPFSAALNGRSEIGMAAIAITMVDVVVFTPVAFMGGEVGQYFRQFGLVIACSTLISLFVSFTLTPLLASRWLSARDAQKIGGEHAAPPASAAASDGAVDGAAPTPPPAAPTARPSRNPLKRGFDAFSAGFERAFEALRARYQRVLDWALRHRWLPPLAGVCLLVGSLMLVPAGFVKSEFLPAMDYGLFSVTVELPPGSSLDATDEVLREVEQRMARIPEVQYYLSTSGTGDPTTQNASGTNSGGDARWGQIQGVLVDLSERKRSVFSIVDQIRDESSDIPGATVRVNAISGASTGAPVQVRIGGDDLDTLERIGDQIQQIVRNTPGAVDVQSSAAPGNPETRLVPNLLRMPEAGVTAQQVASALRTAVQGNVASQLRPPGQDQVDIRLIANEAARANLQVLGALPITGTQNNQPVIVSLNQVTNTVTTQGPTALTRYNRQRVITISANLAGDVPLNTVTRPIRQATDQLLAQGVIPPGYTIEFGGQSEDQSKDFATIGGALGLSIVLEYMLLASLYESMIIPFSVLFALPMAIIGAILALAISHNTINLLSLMGMVVLMALVGKNGILLVDYTNTLRAEGMSRREALLHAGPTRLRPILMTSSAMILGMLPLAMRLEPGSELYAGMATVIIGGMASSTLLSLIVVPCMYTYFDDLQGLIARLAGRGRAPKPPAAPAPTARPTPQPTPSAPPAPMSPIVARDGGT